MRGGSGSGDDGDAACQLGRMGTLQDCFTKVLQFQETSAVGTSAVLSLGIDPDAGDGANDRLCVVAGAGTVQQLELLLKHGADPNWPSETFGCTALQVSLMRPHPLPFVSLLLRYGADRRLGVTCSDSDVGGAREDGGGGGGDIGQSAAVAAFRWHGSFRPMAPFSLFAQFDTFMGSVLRPCGYYSTPLMLAAARNDVTLMETLLTCDRDTKRGMIADGPTDSSGGSIVTPLHHSLQHGLTEASLVLMRYGATISTDTIESIRPAAHEAARAAAVVRSGATGAGASPAVSVSDVLKIAVVEAFRPDVGHVSNLVVLETIFMHCLWAPEVQAVLRMNPKRMVWLAQWRRGAERWEGLPIQMGRRVCLVRWRRACKVQARAEAEKQAALEAERVLEAEKQAALEAEQALEAERQAAIEAQRAIEAAAAEEQRARDAFVQQQLAISAAVMHHLQAANRTQGAAAGSAALSAASSSSSAAIAPSHDQLEPSRPIYVNGVPLGSNGQAQASAGPQRQKQRPSGRTVGAARAAELAGPTVPPWEDNGGRAPDRSRRLRLLAWRRASDANDHAGRLF